MLPQEGLDIEIARRKDSDWKWHLRIDSIGLYRWYLSGRIAMNIKGTSRMAAERALGRFIQRTLRGELEITLA
jgi:hypothetical protein